MTIAPEESCPPTAKLNLNQTLTLTGEQFSLGAIFWLPPTLKLTLTLTQTPTLTGGAIFLRETIVRIPFFAKKFIYLRKKYY